MKSSRNHKLFQRLVRHVGGFWQRSLGFPSSCVVALSGGMDSMLLLEVVASLGKQNNFSVRAMHVDHGIQSKQGWIERPFQDEVNRLGVELVIVRIDLDPLAEIFEATSSRAR